MNKYVVGTIGLVIFILIIIAIYFAFIRGRVALEKLLPPDDTTPTATPSPTPVDGPVETTPTLPAGTQTYEGVLSAVSTDRLGYKNSIIVVLDAEGPVPTTIYVTQNTQVVDVNRITVSRDILRPDMSVRIYGIPAEGAIEALRVEIQS